VRSLGCLLAISSLGVPIDRLTLRSHRNLQSIYHPLHFLPLRKVEAPSAEARDISVESRAEPEVQTASLQPAVRLDIKPTENEIEARPPQTLPERGRQFFAESGHDPTCLPSASAVRQNHPGGWPSWTLRAPGHEGTRCWYAATRTTGHDQRSEMMPRKETVGVMEKLGSPGGLFDVLFGVTP
jgi:hypothetical protein